MARTNEECSSWVTELLAIGPSESVLEVDFGPGVIIQRLSNLAGHVAGIDPSQEMVQQARTRNAEAIRSARVDLRHGSVESLPFDSNNFDKVIAINSMQVWRDTGAGLREIRRVMRPRRQDRPGSYSVFRPAERRLDGKTQRRQLHRRAYPEERQGLLRSGDTTVRV
jgi:ubiquinone/menaquinone biosynthesis C-methylase UbiE